MKTPKFLHTTPRKIIRYLIFSHRDGIKLESPVLSAEKDIKVIEYFESLDNFTSWDGFEKIWDIGMGDDLIASAARKEKWFLCDKKKTEIVTRPADYWEKEADRLGCTVQALYSRECAHREMTKEEFFSAFF